MRDQRRIHALVLCVTFVLVLLVSSAFIVHEADHDCFGEDCHICRMLAASTELLRSFASILVLLMMALLFMQQECVRRVFENRNLPVPGTLISWKIRLNN